MKTLTVVRHAKAGWKNTVIRDFDRPLTLHGQRQVAHVAGILKATRCRPDICLASPAVRAWDTAVAITNELGLPTHVLVPETELYGAMADELMNVIRAIDDRHKHALVCGHNPGLHELVNDLTDASLERLPTCGVVTIHLDVHSWRDVEGGKGRIEQVLSPDGET